MKPLGVPFAKVPAIDWMLPAMADAGVLTVIEATAVTVVVKVNAFDVAA